MCYTRAPHLKRHLIHINEFLMRHFNNIDLTTVDQLLESAQRMVLAISSEWYWSEIGVRSERRTINDNQLFMDSTLSRVWVSSAQPTVLIQSDLTIQCAGYHYSSNVFLVPWWFIVCKLLRKALVYMNDWRWTVSTDQLNSVWHC